MLLQISLLELNKRLDRIRRDQHFIEAMIKYNDLLECHVSGVESSYSDQYNQRITHLV